MRMRRLRQALNHELVLIEKSSCSNQIPWKRIYWCQKILDHAKQYAKDALETGSKRGIQKTVEPTGDLIGNKVAEKIVKVSRSSTKDSPETVKNETENIGSDRDIPKKYIHLQKKYSQLLTIWDWYEKTIME